MSCPGPTLDTSSGGGGGQQVEEADEGAAAAATVSSYDQQQQAVLLSLAVYGDTLQEVESSEESVAARSRSAQARWRSDCSFWIDGPSCMPRNNSNPQEGEVESSDTQALNLFCTLLVSYKFDHLDAMDFVTGLRVAQRLQINDHKRRQHSTTTTTTTTSSPPPPVENPSFGLPSTVVPAATLQLWHRMILHCQAVFGSSGNRLMRLGAAVLGHGFDVSWTSTYLSVPPESFVYINRQGLHGQTYSPSHYVCVEHERALVVVAIRGTFSVGDVMTDIAAFPCKLQLQLQTSSRSHTLRGLVHTGIMKGALSVLNSVRPTLVELLQQYPTYQLLITGHSLGAGTASLLTLLLRCVGVVTVKTDTKPSAAGSVTSPTLSPSSPPTSPPISPTTSLSLDPTAPATPATANMNTVSGVKCSASHLNLNHHQPSPPPPPLRSRTNRTVFVYR